jgi:hypothetical protein
MSSAWQSYGEQHERRDAQPPVAGSGSVQVPKDVHRERLGVGWKPASRIAAAFLTLIRIDSCPKPA